MTNQIRKRGLVFRRLGEHGPAFVGMHNNLRRTCFTKTIRILPGLIDIDIVMGIFNGRDFEAALSEQRDDFFDQGRFAAAGVSNKINNLHKNKKACG